MICYLQINVGSCGIVKKNNELKAKKPELSPWFCHLIATYNMFIYSCILKKKSQKIQQKN